LRVVSFEHIAIESQEQFNRDKGSTLITVNEGVIFCYPEAIRGSEFGHIRLSIGRQILGARQGGLEYAPISDPGCSAMLCQLRFVNGENEFNLNPLPVSHFASSRRTLRRFFMILRATSICFSNSLSYGVI